jgi:hypothetical protein
MTEVRLVIDGGCAVERIREDSRKGVGPRGGGGDRPLPGSGFDVPKRPLRTQQRTPLRLTQTACVV